MSETETTMGVFSPAIRAALEPLRVRLANDEDGWRELCALMALLPSAADEPVAWMLVSDSGTLPYATEEACRRDAAAIGGRARPLIYGDAPASARPSAGAGEVAPSYRGYAKLGIGAYLLNHSAEGQPAELAISVATEEEKAGRMVGDERPNAPGAELSAEKMAVRLEFANVEGLDALEQQLRHLRRVHFPASPAPVAPAADMVLVPREPTGDMLDAMLAPWFGRGTDRDKLTAGWKAAIAAAPTPEGRGIATGDTPTFADVWERLPPVDRAVIAAHFGERQARATQQEGGRHG